MGSETGRGLSIPSKIMAGLAVTFLLGLGLCGAGATSDNKLQEYCMIAGMFCFWSGLLLMIVFGAGWAIVAIGKQLFGKKD